MFFNNEIFESDYSFKSFKKRHLKDLVMILGENFYSRGRSSLVASCHVGRVGGGCGRGRRGRGSLTCPIHIYISTVVSLIFSLFKPVSARELSI
jgi:hypothetical protein